MRKLFLFSITVCLLLISLITVDAKESTKKLSLSDATLALVEKNYSEVLLAAPDTCSLDFSPETIPQLRAAAYSSCGLLLKEFRGVSGLKLLYYTEDGRTFGGFKRYSKKRLSLYEAISRYMPEWEVKGNKAATVEFKDEMWRIMSPETLAKDLAVSYSVDVSHKTKTLTITDKALSDSGDISLRYALVYPFTDLNKDLYEVFKGYLSTTDLAEFSRDRSTYLVLTKSERSRESLARTFSELKVMFDDKLVRTQQIGSYFPKSEVQNIQLIYALISDVKIISYYPNELLPISEASLLPLGLKKYNEIVKARLADDTSSAPMSRFKNSNPDSLMPLPAPTTMSMPAPMRTPPISTTSAPAIQPGQNVLSGAQGAMQPQPLPGPVQGQPLPGPVPASSFTAPKATQNTPGKIDSSQFKLAPAPK